MKELITENLTVIIPVLTGIIGIGSGLLLTIPMISKAFNKYHLAIDQMTRFVRIHRPYLKQPKPREDFAQVILLWDDATEYTAKICFRLGMKKMGFFFRNIIKDNWYK